MFDFDALVTIEKDATSIAKIIDKICKQCDVSEAIAIESVQMALSHLEERNRRAANHHCSCEKN